MKPTGVLCLQMSFLADLISSKKSQLSKDKKSIGKKWVRRGEIKKLREKEQEEKVKRLKREREASKVCIDTSFNTSTAAVFLTFINPGKSATLSKISYSVFVCADRSRKEAR